MRAAALRSAGKRSVGRLIPLASTMAGSPLQLSPHKRKETEMKRIISHRKLALVLGLCGITICTITAYAAITRTLLVQGAIAFDERFNGPADTFITRNTPEPADTVTCPNHPRPPPAISTRPP